MKAIKVQALSKKYGEKEAVKGIDFMVEDGEIFGFLGPNGAGKTSTINMLIGLLKSTSGTIEILGKNLATQKEAIQAEIGVVPDESNLYPEMSGLENLSFCGSLYGMRKDEREKRAIELLKIFQLEDVKHKAFKAYSRGMKRKLTIAAAMMHQPKILFLDEPTSGIDVASARQIRKMIEELHQKGTTIFLTTHYLEEAERLCQRIAFIVDGNIVRTGSVETLKASLHDQSGLLLKLDQNMANLKQSLQEELKLTKVEEVNQRSLKIVWPPDQELTPLFTFFRKKEVHILEAKRMEPTMEEVFVAITGIEHSEEEGGEA
ncbi:ABC transporter ATP-binding protein [Tindallia californiensis]|uniref:ABC-2 type transport system ATP-binding protein n=1 Tax=Tindallia californiensis TaxID=159292 RepID=A0A1H3MCU7_9FIRM|nr:ABC transporter ATP-binding protein [Tindallia californiensis]SDY74517.1 ABC-2 type transport system ATP-binding protein [Tindallia californiensis]